MARTKRLEVCFICDESPCICVSSARQGGKTAKMQAVKEKLEAAGETVEVVRPVRKITEPPPVGINFAQRPLPQVSRAHAVHKVEYVRTLDEIVEIIALQNLVRSGLVRIADNPHIASIVESVLTPNEKAQAWKAQL